VIGLVAGIAHFGVALSWAVDFNIAGYLILGALQAACFAAAVLAASSGPAALATLPAAFMLTEAVRTRWPFGGLPLGAVALGQADGPLARVAGLAGALGVLGVTVVAGVGLAAAVRREWRTAVVASALTTFLVAFASVPFTHESGRIRVAVVQGGGPRGVARSDSDPKAVFERHLETTARISVPVDVVVWPEDVVDTQGSFAGSDEERRIAGLAREVGATLVAGVIEGAGPDRFRNAAVAFGPDGRVVARYDKVHRVPFGEYVPARRFFSRFADLSGVPRDAIPGREPGRLDTPAGRLGVVISFEVFFPDRARAAVRAGGGVLLVPTNASSYKGRMVPAQELAAARLRAWETGRDVVQAAPTGYSAVVTRSGRVVVRSDLGSAALLLETVSVRTGLTPYAHLGDTPVLALSMVGAVAPAMIRRRRRRSKPGSRSGEGEEHGEQVESGVDRDGS
jgi:apolipoprotein N-acyltransferase